MVAKIQFYSDYFYFFFSQDEVGDNISRKTQTIKQLNFFYSIYCIVLEVFGLISSKNPHKARQIYCHKFHTSILSHPPSVQNIIINTDISNFVLKKSQLPLHGNL